MESPEHLDQSEEWFKKATMQKNSSMKRRKRSGTLHIAPKGNARMGANPHANGGLLLKRPSSLPVSVIHGVKRC